METPKTPEPQAQEFPSNESESRPTYDVDSPPFESPAEEPAASAVETEGTPESAQDTPPPEVEEPPGRPCPECGDLIPTDDAFCSGCGYTINTQQENDKETLRIKRELASITMESKKSSRFILILAVLFAMFGTVLGFMNKNEADKAYKAMSRLSESYSLPVNGKRYTVKELRKKIKQEMILIFATNYFLSLVMFGLYFWSRKNLFPAIVAAFAIYLAVQAVNGFIEPKTIYQGLIFKIIFIALFITGVKNALKVRELTASLAKRS
ncbi:zinc ribbon domain-containing protein [Myxococcota bacterium]|nr:zinc ribbon domain-containing protein [Myxococcota bacterium]MBU1536837.1 zinc ribbon domain-containing protein [Myxococcota bacterium]